MENASQSRPNPNFIASWISPNVAVWKVKLYAFYYSLRQWSSNEITIPKPKATLHPAPHQAAGASIIRDPDDAAPRGEWQRRVRTKTQGHANYMWIAFNSEWHLYMYMNVYIHTDDTYINPLLDSHWLPSFPNNNTVAALSCLLLTHCWPWMTYSSVSTSTGSPPDPPGKSFSKACRPRKIPILTGPCQPSPETSIKVWR